MTKEAIKAAVDLVPFTPFTLHLPGGREHRVIARDQVAISAKGRTMVVFAMEGEDMHIIDTALVVEIKTLTSELSTQIINNENPRRDT